MNCDPTQSHGPGKAVYLSLGSNIGDRGANLRAAVSRLSAAIFNVRESNLYETDPQGVTDQPPFMNIVVAGTARKHPSDLLRFVKDVECEVGRTPTYRWGPRVIDIDILLYGDETVALHDLKIPHPELMNRAFVLLPLCELDDHVRFPDGTRICDIERLLHVSDQVVRRVGPLWTAEPR